MYNRLLSLLVAFTLAGCSRPNPDLITLESTFSHPDVVVIGAGLFDTVFVKIPATDDILAIVAHGKNTTFWSGLESDDIINHITPGTCIINAKTDYVGNCPYRLYCGGAIEFMIATAVNTPYATEICK